MRVITEFEACHSDFVKLYNNSWSGAVDTLNMVREYGLEIEFMEYLDQMFCEDVKEGQLNDWLWLNCDIYEFIAQYTSLEDIKDIEELAKYAEELDYREATTTLENAEEMNKSQELWDYLQENNSYDSLYEVFNVLDGFDFDDLAEEE